MGGYYWVVWGGLKCLGVDKQNKLDKQYHQQKQEKHKKQDKNVDQDKQNKLKKLHTLISMTINMPEG